jgi:glycosyltransferase involved in cell wall biosynthesis
MEAMAAGCLVATTTLGALPETAAGFGILMESRTDFVIMAQEYADLVIRTIQTARESPDKFEDHLGRQRAHARTTYSWAARAREWVAVVDGLARQR